MVSPVMTAISSSPPTIIEPAVASPSIASASPPILPLGRMKSSPHSNRFHLSRIHDHNHHSHNSPAATTSSPLMNPCTHHGCSSPAVSPQTHSHTQQTPNPAPLNLSSKTSTALSSPVLCPSSPQTHVHDDACITRDAEDAFDLTLDTYQQPDATNGIADPNQLHSGYTSSDDYTYTAADADGDDVTEIDLSDHVGGDDDNGTDVSAVGVVLCGADKSITHINDAFTRITGYTANDLLGRPSLSLLQGQETSTQAVTTIREAISTQTSCKVCLINYRKDRTPFWNLLTIVPMLNSGTGRVDAWIGIQRLHQPKPYIDKLMQMFPWTQNVPNSHMHAAQKQRRLTNGSAARNALLRHRSSPAVGKKHRQLQPVQGTQPKTVVADATRNSSAHVHPAVRALAAEGLSKPTVSRYSSVEAGTDGEQDFDGLDLDNRALAESTPVSFISETDLPTIRGVFRVRAYKDLAKVSAANGHAHLLGSESEIICIIAGKIENQRNVPVRVHDACWTGEILGSLKCDCREQLEWSMDYIQQRALKQSKLLQQQNGHQSLQTNGMPSSASNGSNTHHNAHHSHAAAFTAPTGFGGMIIYMPQEGRGIGLANKLKAYSLQTALGLDTVDANRALGLPDDLRSYNCVPAILESMQIQSIRLMTNNPRKQEVLERLGVEVSGRIPVVVQPNSDLSARYLQTKAARMQHSLELPHT